MGSLQRLPHHVRYARQGLESLILRIVRPLGNKQCGRVSAEDLSGRFKQDIRDLHRMELNALIGQRANKVHLNGWSNGKERAPLPPTLSAYVSHAMILKATYKGRDIHARVLQDGRILYKGTLYNSPSLASNAVRRFAGNGWLFWKFERSPGDWAILDMLRQ